MLLKSEMTRVNGLFGQHDKIVAESLGHIMMSYITFITHEVFTAWCV